MTFDVAILTDAAHLAPDLDAPYNCQILLEEAWLIHHLASHGLTAKRVAWDDRSIDWTQIKGAVLRSTWDYFERQAEFIPWLEGVGRLTRLVNRYDLLQWNLDKHYLGDMAEQGVAIVPTLYIEKGESVDLAARMQQFGWTNAIIKPVISGAARLTFRVDAENIADMQVQIDSILKDEGMMLQPFMPSVMSEGELSLMVIDGKHTHAIRKTPKAGDFRVQDDHGGTVHPYFASTEEIAFAEQAVAACPVVPAYARIDLVRDSKGQLRIMEMELLEPELFFRFCPDAARQLAAAIAARLA
ncbi:hypothetical protein KSF73_05455 [Burkholderiaceae bacterium DAT-1]|nr:hypothetical protein [Burkholderiaceae bacterium DAT-1]